MTKHLKIHLSDLISQETTTYQYLLLLTAELGKLNGYLYLVGGILRDFFSGIKSKSELDCVIECNLSLKEWENVIWDVAGSLRLEPETIRVRSNPYFLTTSIRGSNLELDFTFPRSEKYDGDNIINSEVTIARAELSQDAMRRDFTFNAIYGLLKKDGAVDIYDPLKGREDLNANLIKATHDNLFLEDLSRIIRLIRFQHLLQCDIEKRTQEQLVTAVEYANQNLRTIENKILQTALEREIRLLAIAFTNHDWLNCVISHNLLFILPEISATTFSRICAYWQIIRPHLSPTAKSLSEIEFFLSLFTSRLAWKPLPSSDFEQRPYAFADLVSNIRLQLVDNKVLFDNKSIFKTVPRYPMESLPDVMLGLQELRKNAQKLHLLKTYIKGDNSQDAQVKEIRRKILLGELR